MDAKANHLHALSLPAALIAGLSAFGIVFMISRDSTWSALAGAVAGGWTLGRLRRR